jgi:hypothetical protein
MSERHLVKLCLFLFSCPCYLFIFECSILLDFFFVLSIDCITRSAEERERREREREREKERERVTRLPGCLVCSCKMAGNLTTLEFSLRHHLASC